MIDNGRQLPTPSARAWRLDLSEIGGPRFIVLRLSEDDAREALALHLVEIGSLPHTTEAKRVVNAAPADAVAVIW